MRVFAINPGSTSTKVGLFDGEKPVFTVNVAHEASELAKFASVSDQLPYRLGLIEAALRGERRGLSSVDAFVGRGGGLLPLPGGTYEVDDVLLDHSTRGANGVQHPAQLGPQIAHALAARCGRPGLCGEPARHRRALRRGRQHDRRPRRVPPRAPARAQPQGDGHPPRGHRSDRAYEDCRLCPSATSAAASPSAPIDHGQHGRRRRHRGRRGSRWPPRAPAPCPWPRSWTTLRPATAWPRRAASA